MRMLCNEERMNEKNLRIGDKMIHTRGKAEGLREKLATILSQDYKELAVQDLKVIGTGVQNIVFEEIQKRVFGISSAVEREVENINEDLFNSRISLKRKQSFLSIVIQKVFRCQRYTDCIFLSNLIFNFGLCVY